MESVRTNPGQASVDWFWNFTTLENKLINKVLSIKISLWLLGVADRQKVSLNDEAAHHQTVFTAHL